MTRTFLVVGIVLLSLVGGLPSYASGIEDAANSAYRHVLENAKKRDTLITSGMDYERIRRISQGLVASAPELKADAAQWTWDVSFIRSSDQNAYCLPGGKIVVFSGLVEQLSLTDDELAAVIGHEIAHAALEHGKDAHNQRQVAKVVVGILGIVAAVVGAKHNVDANAAFNATTGLGSVGAEFFALRPYSRERELDADRFGMELAARAGFDPAGALSLQLKLGATSGGTPEFLSTHPSSDTRVQELQATVNATRDKFSARRSESAIAVARTVNIAVVGIPATHQANIGGTALTEQAASLLSVNMGGFEDSSEAVTGPRLATMTSKYMISGEQYAKAQGCVAPVATMVVRAPTYETFSIGCSDKRTLLVRCTDGVCAEHLASASSR